MGGWLVVRVRSLCMCCTTWQSSSSSSSPFCFFGVLTFYQKGFFSQSSPFSLFFAVLRLFTTETCSCQSCRLFCISAFLFFSLPEVSLEVTEEKHLVVPPSASTLVSRMSLSLFPLSVPSSLLPPTPGVRTPQPPPPLTRILRGEIHQNKPLLRCVYEGSVSVYLAIPLFSSEPESSGTKPKK